MIETMAIVFAGYAAHAAWPWWAAALVGAICGLQVANARMYQGANKDRIAAGDRAVAGRLFQVSAIGIAAGSAVATIVYFAAHAILR